jgi:membrane protease YdiL (CAAX protease family)
MDTILNALTVSLTQLAVFSVIPFIFWLITKKKAKQSFFCWVGLNKPAKPEPKALATAVVLCILLTAFMLLFFTPDILQASATTMYLQDGLSATAVICTLIFAFIQTGLSEEILFRGFLAKRLIHALGFLRGNIVQAVLFGLLHSFIILSGIGWLTTAIIVFFAASNAMVMVYVNEKVFGGSILPSWILHGISNSVPILMVFH